MVVVTGCGQPDAKDTLQRQRCTALGFTLVFDGDMVGGQVFPKAIYLEDRDEHKIQFKPRDAVSVQQSSFAIQPAWSPNHEWLLLPDGRFDGFAAFKANQLPNAIAYASKALRVGVCDESGTRWWHEFMRWKSPSVFEFRAGLSGQFTKFECDLVTGKVTLCSKEQIAFIQLPK